MPWQQVAVTIGVVAVTTPMTIIGYFLKKQNDKLEDMGNTMNLLQSTLTAQINESKGDMVKLFQDVCHERQGACSRLIEQRVENLRTLGDGICRKIDAIKSDRVEKWRKQDAMNDRMQTHVAKIEERFYHKGKAVSDDS